jgi:hypothetical protein
MSQSQQRAALIRLSFGVKCEIVEVVVKNQTSVSYIIHIMMNFRTLRLDDR